MNKLKSYCNITSSKRIYASDYQKQGIPFYRGKEIIEKHKGITVSTKLFISKDKYKDIQKRSGVPQTGDLLLTSIGTLGVPYLVKHNDLFYFKDGNIIWFKEFSKELDSYYFFYWLLSPQGKGELKKCTIGSSQSAFTISNLKEIIVCLPPLTTQRKIASILSAYDDLIENNLQRIKILEEMAQLIYREWFVHYRFPGHEKVKMVDSPLGKIPEGWIITSLGDHLIGLESGKRPRGGAGGIKEGIPSIGAENIIGVGKHNFENEKFVPDLFFNEMKKGIVKDKDIALYKDGANIGRTTYFRSSFPHKIFCVNEHVFLLRSNGSSLTQNYLYLWLQESQTISTIRSTNSNAAQPGINQKGVKGVKLILPHCDVIKKFDTFIDTFFLNIVNLAKTNRILQQTRDLLLPKLISGELDVSDLDIDTRRVEK